jgi:hypothetical protein
MGFGVESRVRMLDKRRTPLTNGTEGGVHVTDAPASLQQRDGHSAADFELGCRAFKSPRDLIGEMELSL